VSRAYISAGRVIISTFYRVLTRFKYLALALYWAERDTSVCWGLLQVRKHTNTGTETLNTRVVTRVVTFKCATSCPIFHSG